jgi:hypothetical protein
MEEAMKIFCRNLREVDALVAEHLMDWTWVLYNPEMHRGRLLIPKFDAEFLKYADGSPHWLPATGEERLALDWIECGLVPHYTTWEEIGSVIQNREKAGFDWRMDSGHGVYVCWTGNNISAKLGHSYKASSIPIAFCLAALASVGVNVKLEM